MNKIILGCCATLALGALVACTSGKKSAVTNLTGEWNIIAVNDAPIAAPEGQATPFLAFDTTNGQLTGNTSCNTVFGSFSSTNPGDITFAQVGSTRMMCPDMALEDAIIAALNNVTKFKGNNDGDEVYLCNTDGSHLLTLKKREDAISGAMLAGTWNVTEIDGEDLQTDTLRAFSMTFEPTDSTFSCETGCNTVNGNYRTGYTSIKIEPTMSTRMMCDSLGNAIEARFNTVLPNVTSFGVLASGNIGLYNSANDLVMILSAN